MFTAPLPDPGAYRLAMRHFAGNVSVITVGTGDRRSGLVATSAVSLSMDPPLMLVCVNRSSSSWPLFEVFGHFGVNSLAPHHQPIAERFTGQGGIKGADRFALGQWRNGPTGAPLLVGASVALDCEIEDMIEKSTHSILIGRVRSIEIAEQTGALVYWRGGFRPIGAVPA
ncbi:MAG: flavin reductase family protein [Rhizobium sp.]|nr:flavin reductase family protein [Rhizobium sp.]MBX9456747.1 flavin reductase family protein [Rhizobium sp.]